VANGAGLGREQPVWQAVDDSDAGSTSVVAYIHDVVTGEKVSGRYYQFQIQV